MAYVRPTDLDGFIPHLGKPDTRLKLQVGNDLLIFLEEPSNSLVCQNIGMIVDGLVPWMQSSNFKVSSNGIEVMTYLIDRLGSDFRPYLQTVLPNVIDRLGDAKDSVREKAQLLILKLLERGALTPQTLVEKLSPCFAHKNAKIREEVLRCLVNILDEHGAHSLTLNRFIPDIVKLLSDPTASVRDTAFSTLVDCYKHVGHKLRVDLQKRNLVPQAKWMLLTQRFDELQESGELKATASRESLDELDRVVMQKPAVPLKKPSLTAALKTPHAGSTSSLSTNSALRRIGSIRKTIPAGAAGALGEDTFTRAFTDVPVVRIFSGREVTDQMKNICEIISNTNNDWNKRVDALKKIRSIIVADGTNYEEFYIALKNLDIAMQTTIKDLRSQVVREACITIAYLAQILGNRYDRTAEFLLLTLINLIQNSVKIMSTSGIVAVKFIIQHIHSPRLIPAITTNAIQSKSKDIRRSCCDFLDFILNNWSAHSVERHLDALLDALRKGVADADPEARVSARKAFHGLQLNFPEQADALLQSLEPNYRRALQGNGMSASSSNNNLSSGFKKPRQVVTPQTDSGRKGFRSNSAIELQAAQRAKARAQYSALARNKIASGTASLQGEVAQQARPRKSPEVLVQTPERAGRNRSRNSQSQPTSRSSSPSSRMYLFNRSVEHDSGTPRYRRGSSGIPRSTTGSREASRETSPSRMTLGRFRGRNDRPPPSPAARPVLAQKILLQSREAENALADAFNGDHTRSPRKTMRSVDNHSDESETSSVCSERSFDSYRRASESYSWSGSQQRLASRELWEPCTNIHEIIILCASTTWQERKDGLLSLQYYLSNEGTLTATELRSITDIFTKMFFDSHTKGLSVFLDTLNEIIKLHKDDLHHWIYILLHRIFLKIGTETLNSVQSKLVTTLETIKASFPPELLIPNIYRYLADATQTPNSKVKTVVLNLLANLANQADGAHFGDLAPTSQVLQKVILFTVDQKSAELRSAARNCIVAMWNCNTPQMTMLLADQPKEYQDIARTIVHSHMRKNSTGSEPGSPMVMASPKPLSPSTPRDYAVDHDEIYRNLRKTTAEIQNYNFETLTTKLDRNRDTTSQDSGISQMSLGRHMDGVSVLEERMDDLCIGAVGPYSLPSFSNGGMAVDATNGFSSLNDVKDVDLIRSIFTKCVDETTTSIEEKRVLLTQLAELIRGGQTEQIVVNFRKLLRLLIHYLGKSDEVTQVIILDILSAIFQSKEMRGCWGDFVELLLMKVLGAYCDEKREVVKKAESTAAAMSVCPFNTVVQTLSPMIQTTDYPTILGAIKMLTTLIEANSGEVTDAHLAIIMPGLIKSIEHEISSVRKSSIFCMVTLYKAVGEDRLSQYTNCLPGSKLKLLRLYISKVNSPSSSAKVSANNHTS